MDQDIWFVPHSFRECLGLNLVIYSLGSDILRLNVLGNNIIILNSLEATTDLLEKRSTIYSDRYT